MGNRCHVCDFEESGMCSNYEVDRLTLNGALNKVFWSKAKQQYVCYKCWESITLSLEEYRNDVLYFSFDFGPIDPLTADNDNVPIDDLEEAA